MVCWRITSPHMSWENTNPGRWSRKQGLYLEKWISLLKSEDPKHCFERTSEKSYTVKEKKKKTHCSFTFSLLHVTRESLFKIPTHTHTHPPQIKNILWGIKRYINIKTGRARNGEENKMAHHSRKRLEFMPRLVTSWFSICFGSPWAGLHINSCGADSWSKGCLS